MIERLTVIVCDGQGCEKGVAGSSYREAEGDGMRQGWSFKGGEFCPEHYPLQPCDFCGRLMRPWTRRAGDPGMEGTIAVGRGGLCQHCSKHRGSYIRMLEDAVESFYRMTHYGY